MFIIEKPDGLCCGSVSVAWFHTRAEVDQYLVEHPLESRWDWTNVYELTEGGGVEHAHHEVWTPKPYTGPIVNARISWPSDRGFHRVPIDCIQPSIYPDLNEDCLYRVVETEHCGTGHHFSLDCHCVGWQDIEGSPEKVAEMVAKYPFHEATA